MFVNPLNFFRQTPHMELCVVWRCHQGKKRPVRKFYVADSVTFRVARNEFVSFETFRNFARNLSEVDFHLCSKGHNVAYHWNVREKGKTVNLYKSLPRLDAEGRIWTIELCKPEILESFPPPRAPIGDSDIVCQFHLPFARDGIEADKQGRAVTNTYVSPDFLSMFSSMVQHQSHNSDDGFSNILRISSRGLTRQAWRFRFFKFALSLSVRLGTPAGVGALLISFWQYPVLCLHPVSVFPRHKRESASK